MSEQNFDIWQFGGNIVLNVRKLLPIFYQRLQSCLTCIPRTMVASRLRVQTHAGATVYKAGHGCKLICVRVMQL